MKTKLFFFLLILFSFFIRIYGINKVPVSLFGDELDVGYQAYSLLKTAKDYSGNFLPLHFESFSDNRTPLYIYLSAVTVHFFGISELGIRLVSIISGTLSVSVFYFLLFEIFEYFKISNVFKSKKFKNGVYFSFIGAIFLAISPWHIQYSRSGFEVSLLILFLLLSFLFLFKSFKKEKFFVLSIFFAALTPWVYSTAKLFIPLFYLVIFALFYKKLMKFRKKVIYLSLFIILLFSLPMVYEVFSGSGAQRFNYINIFSNPTVEKDIDYQIFSDFVYRKSQNSIIEKIESRVIHNKFTYFTTEVVNNYLVTLSTQFLFIKGDLNLRHSIDSVGQFYKIDAIFLLIGVSVVLFLIKSKKLKWFLFSWIFLGILPSSITEGGGYHATRLIIILPALLILITIGLIKFLDSPPDLIKKLFYIGAVLIYIAFFYNYQHNYWVHNPWHSERSWHASYKDVIKKASYYQEKYDKVVFSSLNDDMRIFYASYLPIPPSLWQEQLEETKLKDFSSVFRIRNVYFAKPDKKEVDSEVLIESLGDKFLYICPSNEVKGNLVREKSMLPENLKLVDYSTYPSGEPSFYLLTKND